MKKKTVNGLLLVSSMAIMYTAHQDLRKNSTEYNLFFSPGDLYTHLAESEFDLSNRGLENELVFATKYPGNHWLTLLVENPPETMEDFKSQFEVKIDMLDEEGALFQTVVTEPELWFHGGEHYSGFALATFTVPDDLPLRKKLRIRATVLEESPGFTAQYGQQRIVMSKYPDE